MTGFKFQIDSPLNGKDRKNKRKLQHSPLFLQFFRCAFKRIYIFLFFYEGTRPLYCSSALSLVFLSDGKWKMM